MPTFSTKFFATYYVAVCAPSKGQFLACNFICNHACYLCSGNSNTKRVTCNKVINFLDITRKLPFYCLTSSMSEVLWCIVKATAKEGADLERGCQHRHVRWWASKLGLQGAVLCGEELEGEGVEAPRLEMQHFHHQPDLQSLSCSAAPLKRSIMTLPCSSV